MRLQLVEELHELVALLAAEEVAQGVLFLLLRDLVAVVVEVLEHAVGLRVLERGHLLVDYTVLLLYLVDL